MISKIKITELSVLEQKNINGGLPVPVVLAIIGAVGGACAWVFQKGEELGKAMA